MLSFLLMFMLNIELLVFNILYIFFCYFSKLLINVCNGGIGLFKNNIIFFNLSILLIGRFKFRYIKFVKFKIFFMF